MERAFAPLSSLEYQEKMLIRTIRIFGNICAGTVDQIQYIIDSGVITLLLSMLSRIPSLYTPGATSPLHAQQASARTPVTIAVMTEAAAVLANITVRGSPEQALWLVTNFGIVPVLCKLFDLPLYRPETHTPSLVPTSHHIQPTSPTSPTSGGGSRGATGGGGGSSGGGGGLGLVSGVPLKEDDTLSLVNCCLEALENILKKSLTIKVM